jgi:FixJ family two-component response regulator
MRPDILEPIDPQLPMCPLDKPVVYVVDRDAAACVDLEVLADDHGWQIQAFGDARSFLSQARHGGPACLLLDIDLPDIDGLELQRLVGGYAALPVICTARDASVRTTVRAMKAGAIDFLAKPLEEELLIDAMREALRQSRNALALAVETRALHDRFAQLSHRERDVMRLIVSGRLNKQAADELGISEITVKTHRGRVMRKMRATSLPDLVIMAATLQTGSMREQYDRHAAIAYS